MADFQSSLRVFYGDTDAGGVVYHANYLKFMERSRCDRLSGLGFDVAELHREQNIMFVFRNFELQYHLLARLFDQLTVSYRPLQVGKVKLELQQNIYTLHRLLCSARVKLATLSATLLKPAAMPVALKKALEQDLRA